MVKINRKEIQKKLNVSHSTVSQWLNGLTKPTADKMFILEDSFKIPVNAWRDIKSYLQENDTKQTSEQSINRK